MPSNSEIGAEDPLGSTGRRVGRLGPFLLRRVLSRIDVGRIVVVTPSGERIEHHAAEPGPEAVLRIHHWRAIRRLLTGADLGFAEAYVAGEWSTPDLAALLELAARNMDRVEAGAPGRLPLRALTRIGHVLNRNSKNGSRRNISFHYDLGNAFYAQWLDASMSYSSAIYDGPADTLENAQARKIERIIERLGVSERQRVLEVGCGWGALAMAMARRGAEVTGLTLSTEQLAHAVTRVEQAGLAARVDLRLQDYREVEGRFDRIVSIEMLEAVGERYWPAYFGMLAQRLKPGGTAVLQAITIDERRFAQYRSGVDFIQRYIFPGGMLPTKTIMGEQAARAGLELVSVETFGDSYALTLAEWRRRFLDAWPTVERLGFAKPFRRMWEYYLSYCEAGFRTGAIDVGLYTLKA